MWNYRNYLSVSESPIEIKTEMHNVILIRKLRKYTIHMETRTTFFTPSKNYDFRLTHSQLIRIKRTFDLFDYAQDGTMDVNDLGTAMRELG